MHFKYGITAVLGLAVSPSLAGVLASVAACVELTITLHGKVFYPNSTAYQQHNQYWSNRQDDLTPTCFIAPHNANDVSKAIKAIRKWKAPFTVKSGGHVPFPSSNIEDGVAIDLVELNTLQLSSDKSVVSVGPGNRWRDVANYLLPEGLAVVGGRVGDIGVGGFTLGGGISWFSGRYGWACDNVRSYQVVLANGTIVTATAAQNADLYKALRGGGGPNFGIVTRFDIETFEQGDIWYKESLYPATATDEVVEQFCDTAVNGIADDVDGHPVMFAAYQPALGGVVTQVFRWHAVPPASVNAVPPVFEPFEAIPDLANKNATLTVPDMLDVYPDPAGFRKGWWDTSISADAPDVLKAIIANYGTWVSSTFSDKPEVVAVLLIQPVAHSTIVQMQKNGGNSMNLPTTLGTQMKINTYVTWADASLDVFVGNAATQFVQQAEQTAIDGNAFDGGFRYMNYAERTQDVYGRYGPGALTQLQAAAAKYDPQQVLKKQWKGYFKV
ncbi:hypothetical protein jhhlp_003037 [Lomentospora prolificans]|uniref:FAD-binding PCMH-type domain-containing protein n=1 Tax=Lomentospora prolificans TaxID=41688 RepID=A0A2N3NFS7_9PEZI|nr:hypothetical protein jhhlp_003037 [Lomentospora prolificans]